MFCAFSGSSYDVSVFFMCLFYVFLRVFLRISTLFYFFLRLSALLYVFLRLFLRLSSRATSFYVFSYVCQCCFLVFPAPFLRLSMRKRLGRRRPSPPCQEVREEMLDEEQTQEESQKQVESQSAPQDDLSRMIRTLGFEEKSSKQPEIQD